MNVLEEIEKGSRAIVHFDFLFWGYSIIRLDSFGLFVSFAIICPLERNCMDGDALLLSLCMADNNNNNNNNWPGMIINSE
jgi:hypothetical protein